MDHSSDLQLILKPIIYREVYDIYAELKRIYSGSPKTLQMFTVRDLIAK